MSKPISAILKLDDVQSQMVRLGFEPMGSTPDAMDAHLKSEVVKWAQVIKASGARLE